MEVGYSIKTGRGGAAAHDVDSPRRPVCPRFRRGRRYACAASSSMKKRPMVFCLP